MIVISKIAHEENAGKNKGRNHEFLVGFFAFFLDGIIAKDQANRRKRIENSIKERKFFSAH